MKRLVLLLSVAGVALSGSEALATPLFNQPSVWTGNGTNLGVIVASQTTSGMGTNGFVAFDDFSFASNTTINEVTWFGIYVGFDGLNAAPHTSRWDLLINSDNAGAPGNLIGGQVDDGTVVRTTVGTGNIGVNSFTVYQFTASFPDFHAAAGTPYWFAPVSVAPSQAGSFPANIFPVFDWIQGTGGDALTQQIQLNGGALVSQNSWFSDRAFSLDANPVPEPATIGLLALGLSGLSARRRRRA